MPIKRSMIIFLVLNSYEANFLVFSQSKSSIAIVSALIRIAADVVKYNFTILG